MFHLKQYQPFFSVSRLTGGAMQLADWQWLWLVFSVLAIIPFAWIAVQLIDYARQPTLIDPNVVALLDAPEKCLSGSHSEAIEKHAKTGKRVDPFHDLTAECRKVERALERYPGMRSGKDYRARVRADDAYKAGQWPWVVGGSVFGWLSFVALVYLAARTMAWAEASRSSEKRKAQVAEAVGSMADRKAAEIVHRYGKIRLIDAPEPNAVVDEGKLLDSKGRIKKALLWCLAEEEDEQIREHLRTGYVLLANFQPGVGEENIAVGVRKTDNGSSWDSDDAEMLRQSEAYEKWRLIVDEERQELMSDLEKLDICDTIVKRKDPAH